MNNHKLRGKMAEKGYNISKMARELGYSYSLLYNKVLGKKTFSIKEVSKICDLLKLSQKDKLEIFLA